MPVDYFKRKTSSAKSAVLKFAIKLDRGIIMAVDEEGKLKEIKGGFTFLGWGTVIAGTGIALGGNSSRLKALQENLANFEMMTEWVDAADIPPPGAFITSF